MALDEKSSYYDAGGIEVIKIIRAKLTDEQYVGYCLGNQIKYSCRFNHKHVGHGRIRDAEKSLNYASCLKEALGEMVHVEKSEVEVDLKSAHAKQGKTIFKYIQGLKSLQEIIDRAANSDKSKLEILGTQIEELLEG